MRKTAQFLIGVAALTGCATTSPEPCSGLVYSESGLTHQQFAPCAKAMAQKLDEMYSQVEIVMDRTKPRATRIEARGACLAASSGLARLIREAGGPDRLFRMSWEATELNRFNLDVESARSVYFTYCYYGQADLPNKGRESSHEAAQTLAAQLP